MLLLLSHSIRTPATKLTNKRVHTLNPVETGRPSFMLFEYAIVIGRHQARAMPRVYIAITTVPIIIRTFAAVVRGLSAARGGR